MNRDIYDMRFDGSEEDLILQDFITRAEPANAVNERLMARIYEKIQADKAQKRRRWWRVAAAPRAASPLRLSLGTPLGPLSIEPRFDSPGLPLPLLDHDRVGVLPGDPGGLGVVDLLHRLAVDERYDCVHGHSPHSGRVL